ncbi:hypothetical protein Pcac1_g28080 [Phytophthora cactorum]|nr:hypothetical protein Pcac1_g28080 [Phytophthora cactorum]
MKEHFPLSVISKARLELALDFGNQRRGATGDQNVVDVHEQQDAFTVDNP